jgi:hypothetical protein
VHLPALSGREPLGFLAAVGVVAALARRTDTPSAMLSWCPEEHHAIVHSVHHSAEALVTALTGIIDQIPPGQVLPDTAGFPPPRSRGAPDPLRVTPSQLWYMRAPMRDKGGVGAAEWLERTLWAGKVDEHGHCYVNPFIYTQGRQTIGQFFYYPLEAVRRAPARLLAEALTGWRRYPQVDSWGLDHRPGAVPGAVWLATQGLAYIVLEGDPGNLPEPRVSLWHRLGKPSGDYMVWPLWDEPLKGVGGQITAHLKLPLLYPKMTRRGTISVPDKGHWLYSDHDLRAEKPRTFAVFGATRRPAPDHPAALTPVQVDY